MAYTYQRNVFKVCAVCKKEFLGTISQLYCSKECLKNKHFPPKPKSNKICPKCKQSFQTTVFNKKYCSIACYKKANIFERELKNIPTGTIGAIQELRVSIDLLRDGFEVFRALSPSCSCDLLVHKNNIFHRIEVRTAYRTKNNLIKPSTYKNIKAEILAMVFPNEIIYKPSKNEWILKNEKMV